MKFLCLSCCALVHCWLSASSALHPCSWSRLDKNVTTPWMALYLIHDHQRQLGPQCYLVIILHILFHLFSHTPMWAFHTLGSLLKQCHFSFPTLTFSRWPGPFTDKNNFHRCPLAVTHINHHLHPPTPTSCCTYELHNSFLAQVPPLVLLFSSPLPTPEQKLIHLPSPLSFIIKVSLSIGSFTLLHKHGVSSSTLKNNILFTTLSHQQLPLSLLPIIMTFLQRVFCTSCLGFLCSCYLLNPLQAGFAPPFHHNCSPRSAIISVLWIPRINSQSLHYLATFDIAASLLHP